MKKSKQIKDKLAQMKLDYIEAARAEFKTGCDELFEKNPELKSFAFTAYAPYFNDGDECTYSAHIDYPDINDVSADDIGYNDKYKDLEPLSELVIEFLSQFDNDIYQDVIGNHVKAIITKKGIKVEDYEHD